MCAFPIHHACDCSTQRHAKGPIALGPLLDTSALFSSKIKFEIPHHCGILGGEISGQGGCRIRGKGFKAEGDRIAN